MMYSVHVRTPFLLWSPAHHTWEPTALVASLIDSLLHLLCLSLLSHAHTAMSSSHLRIRIRDNEIDRPMFGCTISRTWLSCWCWWKPHVPLTSLSTLATDCPHNSSLPRTWPWPPGTSHVYTRRATTASSTFPEHRETSKHVRLAADCGSSLARTLLRDTTGEHTQTRRLAV